MVGKTESIFGTVRHRPFPRQQRPIPRTRGGVLRTALACVSPPLPPAERS